MEEIGATEGIITIIIIITTITGIIIIIIIIIIIDTEIIEGDLTLMCLCFLR